MANDLNLLLGLKVKDIEQSKQQLQEDVDRISKSMGMTIDKVEFNDVDKISGKLQKQLNTLSKGLTVNISDIQLGNIDKVSKQLNKQMKDALKGQNIEIPNPVTPKLKIASGEFENILLAARKSKVAVMALNGELAKMSTITDKKGKVQSSTLSYAYDKDRQAIEQYGWVAKQVGGEQVKVWDLLNRKIVDNKQKYSESMIAQEKYFNDMLAKASKIKELSTKQGLKNENYNNSDSLKEVTLLQSKINGLKEKGDLLSNEEKNKLSSQISILMEKVRVESGYSNEVNKGNSFLEKQIDTLNKIKQLSENNKIKNENYDNDEHLNKVAELLSKVNNLKQQGNILSQQQKELLSKEISDISDKIKQENSYIDKLNKSNLFLEKQLDSLNKINQLSKMQGLKNENYSNDEHLNTIAKLQSEINAKKEQSIVISERERQTLTKQISEIEQKVKAESGYASEVNRGIKFLETQITTLENLKNRVVNRGGGNKSEQIRITAEIEKQIEEYQRLIQTNEILGNVENNRIRQSVGNIRNQTNELVRYESSFTNLFKRMSQYAFGGSVIYSAIARAKQGFNDIVEVDNAMRDLKKVTDETSQTYQNFQTQANQTAKDIGATTKDYIQSTADLIQSGLVESLKQAENLAKNVTIYQNIGDLNQEEATKGLIATTKAFNLEAKDSLSIMDKMNEVSNNCGISVKGLNGALMRGGSALSVANNSLSESIALVTTANQSIQDPRIWGVLV